MSQPEGKDYQGMIVLGNMVYAFDTKEEGSTFEKGDFKRISESYKSQLAQNTNATQSRLVGEIVWGTAEYQLSLYNDKDYKSSSYIVYDYVRIGRKKTWIGYEWVDHVVEKNLPTWFRKRASSYKMRYTKVPRIDGYYMVMDMRLRTGLIGKDTQNWKKKLYKNPQLGTSNTLEKDSDFRNNRIWSAFGVTSWNNQIQAYRISFNSY
ncbi:MAG: hypothetical protein ACJAWV_001766 [Flammeovirgaceae bacterium]|jgi:hypothetical protein